MTSEPASVSSHQPEPDGDGPLEAAKLPLKHTGLDIAGQMQSVARAETDLARMVGDYSATVDNTLCVIEIIEETLQQKRKQIAEIQARQEALALEYRQLGRSLDSATRDLAQQFSDIIKDLETDGPISGPTAGPISGESGKAPEASEKIAEALADKAPEASGATADTPADRAAEASEKIASALAESAAQSEAATGLDLETSDLPPVPEFLGDRHDSSSQRDDEPRDGGSGSRGWWKKG